MNGLTVDNSTISLVVGTIGAGLITVISYSFLLRRKRNPTSGSSEHLQADVRPPPGPISPPIYVTEVIKPTGKSSGNDVWEERRQRGIQAASLHTKKDITGKKEKPFGSSYYYAHNSTKTTGGYKDGLTMEDYTMNGPRLLSRNGASVINDDLSIDPLQPQSDDSAFNSRLEPIKDDQPHRRVISITKYLWDDPGNKDGVATIRVDAVPSWKTNIHESTDWKDIRTFTTAINVTLTGEGKDKDGLSVKIEASIATVVIDPTQTQVDNSKKAINVEYILRIPKLYGHVQKVDYISKEKRLLIRLHKQSAIFNKENLKAWPHPQKKMG